MGNMIGILSTVILVSTLATLIFAVGAYVLARRRHRAQAAPLPVGGAAENASGAIAPPLTEPPPSSSSAVPAAASRPEASAGKPAFRRLTPRGEEPTAPGAAPKDTDWEWE